MVTLVLVIPSQSTCLSVCCWFAGFQILEPQRVEALHPNPRLEAGSCELGEHVLSYLEAQLMLSGFLGEQHNKDTLVLRSSLLVDTLLIASVLVHACIAVCYSLNWSETIQYVDAWQLSVTMKCEYKTWAWWICDAYVVAGWETDVTKLLYFVNVTFHTRPLLYQGVLRHWYAMISSCVTKNMCFNAEISLQEVWVVSILCAGELY